MTLRAFIRLARFARAARVEFSAVNGRALAFVLSADDERAARRASWLELTGRQVTALPGSAAIGVRLRRAHPIALAEHLLTRTRIHLADAVGVTATAIGLRLALAQASDGAERIDATRIIIRARRARLELRPS